jgi:hypothetical protein
MSGICTSVRTLFPKIIGCTRTKPGERLDEVSAMQELSEACGEYIFAESKKEFRKL